jgi:hypothetical protein
VTDEHEQAARARQGNVQAAKVCEKADGAVRPANRTK